MNINEKLDYANSRMAGMGLSEVQRAGVLGSLMGESGRGLNTKAHNPKDPNGGSFGIGQWHSERRTGLESFAKETKRSKDDFKTQFDWAMKEATTTHKSALAAVKSAKTVDEAARAWTNKFEKPKAEYARHAERTKAGNFALGFIQGKPITDVGPLASVSLTGAKIDGVTTGSTSKTASVAADGFPTAPEPVGANGFPAAPSAGSPLGGGLSTSLNGIVDGLLGTSSGSKTKDASKGAKGGLEGMISNFMGEANTGAKLGAIAGGIFAGSTGAVMGGLLGQGIGMMLSGVFNGMPSAQADLLSAEERRAVNAGTYGPETGNYGYSGLSDYGRNAYNESGQVRDAVDSKSVGLY